MMFHPPFRLSKEDRLIYDGPTGAPAPAETPETEATPEKTVDQLKTDAEEKFNKLKEAMGSDPKFAEAHAALKIDEAATDHAKIRQSYTDAVEKTATAYYKAILVSDHEEEAQKKVQEVFGKAGVQVKLEGDQWKVDVSAKGPEKARELTAEEKKLRDEIVRGAQPGLKVSAEKVTTEFLLDPTKQDIPNKYLQAAKRLDRKAAQALPKYMTAKLNNEQPKNIPAGTLAKLDAFWNGIGPGGQEFAKRVLEMGKEASAGGKELTDQERHDMVEGAKSDLKIGTDREFDASKASEADKDIMLARLAMRGIDTSDPDLIFDKSKPAEARLKPFEGTPFERGFYRVMGLIGYVMAYLKKLEQIGKPKEKKNPPSGQPEKTGPSPEKEALRKKLKEQMKPDMTGNQLRNSKDQQLKETDKASAQLRSKIQEQEDAYKEAGVPTTSPELEENKSKLQQSEKKAGELKTEVAELDAMKQEAEALSQSLEQEKKVVLDLLSGLPEGKRDAIAKALSFSFHVDGNSRLELLPGFRVAPDICKRQLNDLVASRLTKTLSELVHFEGNLTLQNPEELKQVFEQLATNIRAEINRTNNPAAPTPGPAAAPPAATPPAGPTAAPTPGAAPSPAPGAPAR